jgi:hypothetical protein
VVNRFRTTKQTILLALCTIRYQNESSVWFKEEYSYLNALYNALIKHSQSKVHLRSFVKLTMFGTVRVDLQLSEQRRMVVTMHNDMVTKNREVLRRLIDTVCF